MPSDPTGLYRNAADGRYLQVIPMPSNVAVRGASTDFGVRWFDADLQDAMLPTPIPSAEVDHEVQRGRWERCNGPWLVEKGGQLQVVGDFNA